jgi:hypothetical protein
VGLAEAAIEAQGGIDRWREIKRIEVDFRGGGIAMPFKSQPDILRRVSAVAETARPRVEFRGIGTFDGLDPRPAGMARRFRWNRDDVIHFAGYALWGYLTVPFIFADEDVEVVELSRRRLRVDFPPRIPAHCRRQVFHFDENAVLTRLDYTAEVILGPLARAHHHLYDHEWIDGLLVSRRRRVTPPGLPAPTLVSIDIDRFRAR